MSMCICLHLPVLILLVDSDWLISIKIGQSLTGNRNYFQLRQSWSTFDQVRQSGVYTIKVFKSKSVKVTWSNFDQVNFDSVNRLLQTDASSNFSSTRFRQKLGNVANLICYDFFTHR